MLNVPPVIEGINSGGTSFSIGREVSVEQGISMSISASTIVSFGTTFSMGISAYVSAKLADVTFTYSKSFELGVMQEFSKELSREAARTYGTTRTTSFTITVTATSKPIVVYQSTIYKVHHYSLKSTASMIEEKPVDPGGLGVPRWYAEYKGVDWSELESKWKSIKSDLSSMVAQPLQVAIYTAYLDEVLSNPESFGLSDTNEKNVILNILNHLFTGENAIHWYRHHLHYYKTDPNMIIPQNFQVEEQYLDRSSGELETRTVNVEISKIFIADPIPVEVADVEWSWAQTTGVTYAEEYSSTVSYARSFGFCWSESTEIGVSVGAGVEIPIIDLEFEVETGVSVNVGYEETFMATQQFAIGTGRSHAISIAKTTGVGGYVEGLGELAKYFGYYFAPVIYNVTVIRPIENSRYNKAPDKSDIHFIVVDYYYRMPTLPLRINYLNWGYYITPIGSLTRSTYPGVAVEYKVKVKNLDRSSYDIGFKLSTENWPTSTYGDPSEWEFKVLNAREYDESTGEWLWPTPSEAGEATVILSVKPPPDLLAGTYRINITSASHAPSEVPIGAWINLTLIIEPVGNVKLVADENLIEINPGGTAKFIVKVFNYGNDIDTISISYSKPSSEWKVELNATLLEDIPPKSYKAVEVAVTDLTGHPPNYELNLILTGVSHNTPWATDTIMLTTRIKVHKEVSIASRQPFIKAFRDSTVVVEFVVRNEGNYEDTFDLWFDRLPVGWIATLDKYAVTLPPGGEEIVKATIHVHRNARFQIYTVTVAARSRGDSNVISKSSTLINVIMYDLRSERRYYVGEVSKLFTLDYDSDDLYELALTRINKLELKILDLAEAKFTILNITRILSNSNVLLSENASIIELCELSFTNKSAFNIALFIDNVTNGILSIIDLNEKTLVYCKSLPFREASILAVDFDNDMLQEVVVSRSIVSGYYSKSNIHNITILYAYDYDEYSMNINEYEANYTFHYKFSPLEYGVIEHSNIYVSSLTSINLPSGSTGILISLRNVIESMPLALIFKVPGYWTRTYNSSSYLIMYTFNESSKSFEASWTKFMGRVFERKEYHCVIRSFIFSGLPVFTCSLISHSKHEFGKEVYYACGADLTGDGFNELVLVTRDLRSEINRFEAYSIIQLNGEIHLIEATSFDVESSSKPNVYVVDVDGDECEEVLLSCRYGRESLILIMDSMHIISYTVPGEVRSIAGGDIDSDELNEIAVLVKTRSPQLLIYEIVGIHEISITPSTIYVKVSPGEISQVQLLIRNDGLSEELTGLSLARVPSSWLVTMSTFTSILPPKSIQTVTISILVPEDQTPGKIYKLIGSVRSLKDSWYSKQYTIWVEVVDVKPPSPLTGLTYEDPCTGYAITLKWNPSIDDSGRVKYLVYRDGVLIGETIETHFTDNNVTSIRTYIYEVVPIDMYGNRGESGKIAVKPIDLTPPTPRIKLSSIYVNDFNLPLKIYMKFNEPIKNIKVTLLNVKSIEIGSVSYIESNNTYIALINRKLLALACGNPDEPPLEGYYQVTVYAQDISGLNNTVKFEFYYDKTKPKPLIFTSPLISILEKTITKRYIYLVYLEPLKINPSVDAKLIYDKYTVKVPLTVNLATYHSNWTGILPGLNAYIYVVNCSIHEPTQSWSASVIVNFKNEDKSGLKYNETREVIKYYFINNAAGCECSLNELEFDLTFRGYVSGVVSLCESDIILDILSNGTVIGVVSSIQGLKKWSKLYIVELTSKIVSDIDLITIRFIMPKSTPPTLHIYAKGVGKWVELPTTLYELPDVNMYGADLSEQELRSRIVDYYYVDGRAYFILGLFEEDETPPPIPPRLYQPPEKAIVTDRTLFSWSKVPDAYCYKLEFEFTSSKLGALTVSYCTNTTSLIVLMPPGTYKWRVVAYDEALNPIVSRERTVIFERTPPAIADFTLKPERSVISCTTGDEVVHEFTLTNTGGLTDEYVITASLGHLSISRVKLPPKAQIKLELRFKSYEPGNYTSIITVKSLLTGKVVNATAITQVYPYIPEVTIQLKAGWNLISVPLAIQVDLSELLNGKYYVAYMWSSERRGYIRIKRTPPPGHGFWIFVLEDVNITISGEHIPEYTLELKPGWNIISGVYGATANFTATPSNAVYSKVFIWDPAAGSYRASTVIPTGMGAWILVYKPCLIKVKPIPPPPPQ